MLKNINKGRSELQKSTTILIWSLLWANIVLQCIFSCECSQGILEISRA